jgi:hypothetical protein
MVLVRGIVAVVACCILFAVAGGFVATALNRLAPGYYPGVFPLAHEYGYAARAGLGTGIVQGLTLGLVVGAVLALGLGWFGQLQWAACARGLAIVVGTSATFAVGGTLVGLALGRIIPDYYRGVFTGGGPPDLDPVDVAVGLGCSQGLIVGVFVGAALVVFVAWRRWNAGLPSASRTGIAV